MSTSTRTARTATTATRTTRRLRRLAATTGLVAVIALGAAACSNDSGSPKAASADPAGTPISTLAPKAGTQTGVTTQPGTQPTSQPTTQPTSQPTTQPQGQPTTQPQPQPQPSGPAPTITSFWTPENIDCHNGNFQNFTARWTTQNTGHVTISIDGPGVYNTYGPNEEISLPFNCSSSHSFTLTAFGSGGQTVSQTITLQPRNVQGQGTGDPNE